MSTESLGKRRRRWWLWLRAGVAAGLLVWVGRYAYLRLTVMPPLAADELHARLIYPWTPEPGDVTEELTEILTALAEPVPLTIPDPPAGMRWEWPGGWGPPASAGAVDAVNGPWTPASRPHLQSVISHLKSPETRELIARLHRLRGRPWHFDLWASFSDEDSLGHLILWDATSTLTADARYQHTHCRDVAAAWEDYEQHCG